MRSLLAVVAATLTTACAGGSSAGSGPAPTPAPAATTVVQQAAAATPVEPPRPANIDPAGNYAVNLTYGGMPISVTLWMGKTDAGALTGSITADGVPTMPLGSITVAGKRVTATMTSPDGAGVTMEFTIEGADLTGSWRGSNGDGSAMTGKKIP